MKAIISLLLVSFASGRPGVRQDYPVECPASTDGFPVFLPHPTNCTLYYECQGDWPILMECAPPLYFDPSLDVCNYPDLVDCVQPTTAEPEVTTEESATTKEPEASTTEGENTEPATTEAPVTSEEPEVSTTESDNTEEPATTAQPITEGTTTVSSNVTEEVTTAATEHPIFNKTTTELNNATEEATTEVVVTTTEDSSVNSTENDSKNRMFSNVNSKNFTVECPESTDGFPVFLPHPANCSLYYECQGDWPILMECAPPLYFDPTIDVCNFPHLVDCVQPSTVKPEVSTTEAPIIDTTTAGNNATEEVTSNAPNGNSTTEVVPTTTEDIINTTTVAANVTEEATTNAPISNSTTEEITTSTESGLDNSTETEISKFRMYHQMKTDNFTVSCPESTDGFPVYLPHPTNCTLYYECQGDWPILMECAPPLYFDPSINICNYPYLVDCHQSTTEEPSKTTTESNISTTDEVQTEPTAMNTTMQVDTTVTTSNASSNVTEDATTVLF